MKTIPHPKLTLVACNPAPMSQPSVSSEERLRAASAIRACLNYMLADAVTQDLPLTAEMIEATLAALDQDIGL